MGHIKERFSLMLLCWIKECVVHVTYRTRNEKSGSVFLLYMFLIKVLWESYKIATFAQDV